MPSFRRCRGRLFETVYCVRFVSHPREKCRSGMQLSHSRLRRVRDLPTGRLHAVSLFADLTIATPSCAEKRRRRRSTNPISILSRLICLRVPPSALPYFYSVIIIIVMAAQYGEPFYFVSVFLLLSYFFPRLFSAIGHWMSTVLPHMMWP